MHEIARIRMSGRRSALAALALVVAGLLGGCSTPSEELPLEVVGRWVTSEPRYADRFLEIGTSTVRFGTGGNSAETYPIAHVAAEPHPRGRLFLVTYVVVDSEVVLGFHFDAADGAIRLQNQPAFRWTKAGRP